MNIDEPVFSILFGIGMFISLFSCGMIIIRYIFCSRILKLVEEPLIPQNEV